MPPKEISNPLLYIDGEPITGCAEIVLPEIKGGSENEMPDMREYGGNVVCLQKLLKYGGRGGAGKAYKEHSQHIKLNSLYGLEHKKRNGKFVRHCRGIGGIRAWQRTGNEKKGS